MRIRILSRTAIEAGGANDADAVISIRGTADGDEPDLALALAQATKGDSARLLRLRFDDIAMPAIADFVGPTLDQVQAAIHFGRRIADGRDLFDGPVADPLIVVHCEHGRSRSAAIGLALLADAFGHGRESDAVNTLLRDDVEVLLHPNPLIVDLADTCLLRAGSLNAALLASSARYARWRQLWKDIEADPAAYRDKVKAALAKRSH
jgi:predicted protein tyrosine phosphatase